MALAGAGHRPPLGQNEQNRTIALSRQHIGDIFGIGVGCGGQDEQRLVVLIGRRLDAAAQLDIGAGAFGEVDDPRKARRRLRQRVTAAVIAARQLRAKRNQRPQRDEGDDPHRDHCCDQPRVEGVVAVAAPRHARAQFFGTVSSE